MFTVFGRENSGHLGNATKCLHNFNRFCCNEITKNLALIVILPRCCPALPEQTTGLLSRQNS